MQLLNSFSFNMVSAFPVVVKAKEISLEEAKVLAADAQSAVGHVDTANVFAEQLDVPVPAARVTVSLHSGDTVLVGQYRGPRLPEGCTTLPAEATIQWLLIELL